MACIVLFISMLRHFDRLFHILLLVFSLVEGRKDTMDLNEARRVLGLVCIEIGKLENASSDPFSRPIIEAACQNAYHVVREILYHSSRAGLQSTDKNGHDIIQLAIINRSEKIYNLLYDIGERRNVYRTCKDSCGNNILHLAGKLAPSSVLNRRTGAALQLQRELQWFQEVEKFVFPSCTTQENIDKETPYKVFTREHKDLLKEGEQWMKTTAESCSITAALIVTIVFAAAITVPGGSNQEKGTPLFKSKVAFIIFAIADAISLFASSTALLVFLSILTTRFAEKDFLVSLPRRLFIGIFSLLLSTITMMVAFSATLFLVFCDNKPWMLAPICGLAFIPIAFFVSLQFPLMVDLLRSTYSSIFGAQRESTNLRILVNRILEKLGVWFAR
ncbi:putative ankyrin repeat-containing domain, PGG domain, ankyrin repeat-containing domain superfamily [Helianthus annuus]|uniref:Ankyrin repeat-containing domain, PGG domain, ankyrin repeat-containing domain superfamily n=2 Tax=Helianthus annuus TaxID=4232 RepID=A0A9K3N7N2_HELAN|nr:putative ankyrin repeat-containing domain, PGG domain, ankyrin repeat-containing domain superfamily [Helianthus annuus]KAJ0541090.1 putative PGG domain, ankyrin repeat-containing domain superfamily [Helianthus annuus]KAJ0706176.1 putative PGG domain, ankyrin repeat-containing domain superfamily [Helianthus annuus]KAJ0891660.1 putative ankyrin repeat-containing domain, PGG domain, ankyrin repeat-containing domain superfamily [Helianthus annuus]